jgi:hypothetical protein
MLIILFSFYPAHAITLSTNRANEKPPPLGLHWAEPHLAADPPGLHGRWHLHRLTISAAPFAFAARRAPRRHHLRHFSARHAMALRHVVDLMVATSDCSSWSLSSCMLSRFMIMFRRICVCTLEYLWISRDRVPFYYSCIALKATGWSFSRSFGCDFRWTSRRCRRHGGGSPSGGRICQHLSRGGGGGGHARRRARGFGFAFAAVLVPHGG